MIVIANYVIVIWYAGTVTSGIAGINPVSRSTYLEESYISITGFLTV